MQTRFIFKREFEGRFRLWHWLMALCVFGLLATGLLRETYLNSGKNSKVIVEKLSEYNITIDKKEAKEVAVAIRNPMWQWHEYFGFGLLGVALFGIYVRRTCKDSCPITNAKSAYEAIKVAPTQEDIKTIKEFMIIKISHGLFFMLLTVMLLTGFGMYFKESFGLSKELVGVMKEIHELGLWLVLLFVAAHIAGVVRKELTSEHGLVSSVIGGK